MKPLRIIRGDFRQFTDCNWAGIHAYQTSASGQKLTSRQRRAFVCCSLESGSVSREIEVPLSLPTAPVGAAPLESILLGPFLIGQIDRHVGTEASQCRGKEEIHPIKAAKARRGRRETSEADGTVTDNGLPPYAGSAGLDPRPRCCAGPTSCKLRAVPIRGRCQNACGKIPMPLRLRIVFLCEQADIVAQREQALE